MMGNCRSAQQLRGVCAWCFFPWAVGAGAPATQHPWAWIWVLPRAGKGLSQTEWTHLWAFSAPLVTELHTALLPSWLVPHCCAVGRREKEAPGPFAPVKHELCMGSGSRSPALNTP